MPLAEMMMRASYGRSADPNSQENQNKDFLDGFAVGFEENEKHGTHAIVNEYFLRGGSEDETKELVTQEGFIEWKIGYWAGVWTRYDRERQPFVCARMKCERCGYDLNEHNDPGLNPEVCLTFKG